MNVAVPALDPHATGNRATRTGTAWLLWLTVGLATLWEVGAHVDAWHHSHFGFEIESFLTLPHALLYGSWFATGAVLLAYLLGRIRRGLPPRDWLPTGYPLVLGGVVLFGLGGIFDSVWHSMFGFEVRLETLLSPAHLWLVVSYSLTLFGLIHAAAGYRTGTRTRGFRPSLADVPLIVGLALLFRTILWSLFYSDPLAVDYASGGVAAGKLWGYQGVAWQGNLGQVAGVTGALLHTMLLALILVVPLRRFQLPGGAIAAIMLWDGLLTVWVTDQWLYLPAVGGAALVGEALWAWMWRGGFGGKGANPGYWLIAFVVPLVLFAGYFALMERYGGGIIWTAHLVAGLPVMAGFYGLFVALLTVPPSFLKQRVQTA